MVRRAHAGDVDAIGSIVERAYSMYIERIGRRPAPMDDDYAQKVREGLVDIADDGGPVGLIVLVPAPGHLLIENVAVAPEHQGTGVGRLLLRHAEQRARALRLDELRLYTNAAMTENLMLYPRLGYQERARRSEDGFERVYFSKRIAPSATAPAPRSPRGTGSVG